MADFKGEDFKFPDEIDDKDKGKPQETNDDDFEIEIIDDIPDRDKGRKPLDREVLDLTDEEINQYTKGAQERIKELTHARHDERRAKEAALRERQELDRITQQLVEENKRLKQYVNTGTEQYTQMAKTAAEAELDKARREYKAAQEAFDTDAIIAAQEALTEAKMKVEATKNFRPTPLQDKENDVQIQHTAPDVPRPDEKTLRWQAKNQWFGSPGYEEMTAFALGLHQKLVATGYDPRSEEYFEKIDSRLKSVFPDLLQDDEPASRKTGEPSKKPATVVASATRSTGAKKTIKLTATQAALADKLGIPRELYAKEFLKQEARNG